MSFPTPPKKTETTTRTFRLDEDVEKGLQELAEKESVSVNVIANRALRKHIEWDALAQKFGFMSYSSTIMVRMVEHLTNNEVREMGAWTAKNLWREATQYWFKRMDLGTAFETLRRLGLYGNRFRIDISQEGPRYSLVIKHDQGTKWSLYYDVAITGFIGGILGDAAEVTAETTENQVTAEIVLKAPAKTSVPPRPSGDEYHE